MGFSKYFGLSAVAISLIGCGGPQKQWVKDSTPHTATEQAIAECTYQAEAATIGIGAGSHPKTFSKAISMGISDGVVRAMDEQELVEHCMQSKGFVR